MKRSPSIVFPLTALCGFALSSFGADVINDTWIDGTRTDPASPAYSENGTDADLDGNIESAWFRGGAGTLTPVAGGPMTGGGYAASSASWYTYFTPSASPVTLANPGDQIKLTLVFSGNNINANNTSQGFLLALAQSPSASRVTADASVPSAVYAGYSMFMNMGQTLGNANPFQLREWNQGATAGALLGTSGNWTALANGATSGNHGYDSGTDYTLVLSLTRNAANGLDIVSTMTGGTLNGTGTATVSFTDTTPNSFTYDTLDIRPANTAQTADSFDWKRARVEFGNVPVPEPSTLALAGLGLLSFLSFYRRQRR